MRFIFFVNKSNCTDSFLLISASDFLQYWSSYGNKANIHYSISGTSNRRIFGCSFFGDFGLASSVTRTERDEFLF